MAGGANYQPMFSRYHSNVEACGAHTDLNRPSSRTCNDGAQCAWLKLISIILGGAKRDIGSEGLNTLSNVDLMKQP